MNNDAIKAHIIKINDQYYTHFDLGNQGVVRIPISEHQVGMIQADCENYLRDRNNVSETHSDITT